jgi:hypothetical protein
MGDTKRFTSLAELVAEVNAFKGSWIESQDLAWDVNRFLWSKSYPYQAFIYTNIRAWADLLQSTIDHDDYNKLDKEQVLSVLFGLNHRNRLADGLWCRMFERGVTQKLLERLLALES